MAAVGAQKLNRPVRLALTKDDDMVITGKRNPFKNDFKVGFDESGKIIALEVKLFSDGGAYADLSTAIMERAMLHSDNAYFISNIKVTGQVCRTNHHPHTAYCGFGAQKELPRLKLLLKRSLTTWAKTPLRSEELINTKMKVKSRVKKISLTTPGF